MARSVVYGAYEVANAALHMTRSMALLTKN